MNKWLFATIITLLSTVSFGQKLAQVTLSSGGSSDIITFITDDAVIINMSKDGKIIDFGIDGSTGRYYNQPGRLDKFMGRTEYYAAEDNKEDFRGKIKYIGRTYFTYYTAYENEAFKGKVKNIGSVALDYYTNFDDDDLKGKIKNAGVVSFSYYKSFENEACKGKLKNVGNSAITYYSSFEDKAFKGKIKSIGSQTFSYYSSFDRPEYRGAMKGIYQQQYVIDGIKYLLRN